MTADELYELHARYGDLPAIVAINEIGGILTKDNGDKIPRLMGWATQRSNAIF
jgi:hypothetical protein